jgi:hypothetical protein
LAATDTASSVREVRVGNTCASLGDWQLFRSRLWWRLAGQHGDTASVCVQYRDRAGNMSDTVEQGVQLDFYPALPSSARYRIVKDVQAVNGSIAATSGRFQMHGTSGQTLASGSPMESTNYQATLGFWSGQPGDTPWPQPSVTLSAERTYLPADGVSTTVITAHVQDAEGQALPNQTVTFTTTLGTITPATVTADANGVSTATLQAATTPGTAIVGATTGTAQDTIDIRFGAGGHELYLPLIQR